MTKNSRGKNVVNIQLGADSNCAVVRVCPIVLSVLDGNYTNSTNTISLRVLNQTGLTLMIV